MRLRLKENRSLIEVHVSLQRVLIQKVFRQHFVVVDFTVERLSGRVGDVS